ncbi:MAG: hypothetical protein WC928_03920 [Patescibacteria group bacterium]|jgi:capsular polysaccharide biosynthesis protein
MNLTNLIRQKRSTLISIVLIFVLIGLLAILTQDFKYGVKSKILVIQEGAGRVDPFSVSRSVEYLSDLFTKVVYSNTFFEAVMSSDFNIDKSYFGDTSAKKIKNWKKTVATKSVEDSGIINIDVYHPDSYQAVQIALAVNHILISQHQNYHGLGTSVKISVIDQPVASTYPVKPNIVFSLLIVIAGGLFFGLVYIYLFPEKKYDLSLFVHKNHKTKVRGEAPIARSINNVRNEVGIGNIKRDSTIQEDDYSEVRKSGDIDNLFQ